MTSLRGDSVVNKTIGFGEYIGQLNNGNHATLFDDMNDDLSGTNIPVPVVDHNGNFQGWATFHVVSGDQGGRQALQGLLRQPLRQLPTDHQGLRLRRLPALPRDPELNLVN